MDGKKTRRRKGEELETDLDASLALLDAQLAQARDVETTRSANAALNAAVVASQPVAPQQAKPRKASQRDYSGTAAPIQQRGRQTDDDNAGAASQGDGSDGDQGYGDPGDPAGAPDTPPAQRRRTAEGEPSEWAKRLQGRYAAYRDKEQQRRHSLLANSVLYRSRKEHRMRQDQVFLQECLDSEECLHAAAAAHQHVCRGITSPDQTITLHTATPPSRQVVCYSTQHRFTVTVRCWRCSACGDAVEIAPEDVGYWGATPTRPELWFDIETMNEYQVLQSQGVTATGTYVPIAKTSEDECKGALRQ